MILKVAFSLPSFNCILHNSLLYLVYENCDSNICENGATCKVLAGDYICECLPAYTGAFCENKSKTIKFVMTI